MVRGLFTNPTVRNLLAVDLSPGETVDAVTGERLPLWIAAKRYAARGTPVVIVAGERYGTGSSRDWAAKGASLLGARAILAMSFERIHRSNLINMGILPLRLPCDAHPSALGLGLGDRIGIDTPETIQPRAIVRGTICRADGTTRPLELRAEVETGLEAQVLNAGGMLPMLLRSKGA